MKIFLVKVTKRCTGIHPRSRYYVRRFDLSMRSKLLSLRVVETASKSGLTIGSNCVLNSCQFTGVN